MKYELVKFVNNNLELEVTVSPDQETVWLTKDQMALLFDRDRTVISRHIKNIFKEGEIDENTSCAKNARQVGGQVHYKLFFNLDVVISVGYRVKSSNGVLFRKWAANVLKEYLIKGYVINRKRTMVTNENYINLINRVDSLDNRLEKLENENLFFPKSILIKENDPFDALMVINDLISRAKQTIILIDPYTDTKTLNVLKNKKDDVLVSLFTSDKTKLSEEDIDLFNNKYNGLSMFLNNNYHDRYLIVDDIVFYHLGSSINYLGNKFAQIDKIKDEDIISLLRKRIDEQKQKGCRSNN